MLESNMSVSCIMLEYTSGFHVKHVPNSRRRSCPGRSCSVGGFLE